jgi:predicted Holliday junction resolvase-like endonuclease
MIVVIVITVIGILMIRNSIKEFNNNINKIRELENRLNEYYKEREQRLKDKGLINNKESKCINYEED